MDLTRKALAIIQARLGSARLPNKMLLPVGGIPLIRRAWEDTSALFGITNTVVAIPAGPENEPLRAACGVGAIVFSWDGPESDVLGRLHACANHYRQDLADVIARITPDDVPVDPLRERFTLGWLNDAHATVTDPVLREHVGHLLPGRVEVNTAEDYAALEPFRSPFDCGPWSPC